jgi:hypothetical protein
VVLAYMTEMEKRLCAVEGKDTAPVDGTRVGDALAKRLEKIERELGLLISCEGSGEEKDKQETIDGVKGKLDVAEKRIREELLCQVCFERNRDTLIMPCMHMVCCSKCAVSVDRCPICRGVKSAVITCLHR